MSLNFVNRNASVPDPPEDTVYFKMAVNRENCTTVEADTEARLQAYEADGVEIPLYELLASAGAHFRDGAVDFGDVGGVYAEMQRAWDNLAHSSPRAIYNADLAKKRLVVTKATNNPRANALAAEILAVGVGLHIATKFYDTPLQFWSPTGLKPTDFEAYDGDGRLIKVEVRGRFEGNNWKYAVQDIHRKLKDIKNFDRAIGVVFALRESNTVKNVDIEIADPAGEHMQTLKQTQLRAILRHYAPFFERQGYTEFGTRLRELSCADEDRFTWYLRNGDPLLQDKNIRTHRTFFRFNNQRFEGTAWDNTAWPASLTGLNILQEKGYFYWGLWDEVIKALKKGNLRDIAEMQVKPDVIRLKDRVLIILEDATALGWAPSETELSPSMFEN